MPPRLPVWQAAAGNATGVSPQDDMAEGQRWAAALKRRFPGQRPGSLDVKGCAAAFAVYPRTAEGWAAGKPPLRRHLLKGWILFGWAFLAEVLGAALPGPAEVDEQLAEMRRDLAALDERLRRLGGRHGT